MADLDAKIDERRNRPGYDEDFAAWIAAQAAALREGRFDELDIDELVDEVESLAKRDFRALMGAIRVIVLHMLKWDFQREERSESWRRSIKNGRQEVIEELAESPSFKSRLAEAVERAYPSARNAASDETGVFLHLFPKECPYSWDEIMNRLHDLDPDVPLSID